MRPKINDYRLPGVWVERNWWFNNRVGDSSFSLEPVEHKRLLRYIFIVPSTVNAEFFEIIVSQNLIASMPQQFGQLEVVPLYFPFPVMLSPYEMIRIRTDNHGYNVIFQGAIVYA